MTDSTATTAPSPKYSWIDRLKCFNAKERYWVVRQALGHFQPTDAFVQAAAKAAGVEPPSESAHSAIYLAMDYHLNWLHAALSEHMPSEKPRGEDGIRNFPLENAHGWSTQLRASPKGGFGNAPATTADGDDDVGELLADGDGEKLPSPNTLRYQIENSQEDVDLLLAYLRPDGVTQIILIEAKCTSGFTPQQLQSKAIRLAGILDGKDLPGRRIDVKLVLMSPKGLQRPETLEQRIELVRSYCADPNRTVDPADNEGPLAGEKYTNLVPAPAMADATDGWGWMPLQIAPLDGAGFWVVEFGSGKANESTNMRIEAGRKSERWYWPTWFLRRRKRIVAKD